ncbi:MAG: HAD hydrolase family protein [Bacteroidales bacterium]|jgi:3-deoxy-D-manno-octulosonate 8-phosphate phosphatase (KDO 8-P phosphatase)|nr:HAD hydrolase family protein [Bacteroidales bacterium]
MGIFKEQLKQVKAFVFDVDGVFTNGVIHVFADGSQMRSMNVKDGYATHFAAKKGYPIAIITGGKCPSVIKRFNDLGVFDVYIASHDKIHDYEDFLQKYNLTDADILYVGDDLPDYKVMTRVGLCACPNDASYEIQEISDYISEKQGGCGCVRDIIEQTLRAHGKWLDNDAFVW